MVILRMSAEGPRQPCSKNLFADAAAALWVALVEQSLCVVQFAEVAAQTEQNLM